MGSPPAGWGKAGLLRRAPRGEGGVVVSNHSARCCATNGHRSSAGGSFISRAVGRREPPPPPPQQCRSNCPKTMVHPDHFRALPARCETEKVGSE